MDLVSLRRLLDKEPNNALAWRTLGLRLAHDGDALAESALRHAYELNPADVESGTGLGEILLATGRVPEAFDVLKSVTSRAPNYAVARMALGRLYRRKASYLHASEEFEAAVKADKELPDGWYELTICYLQMQQAAKAQASIAEALRQVPNEPRYLALKGSVDTAVGNVDAGIAAARQAAELAPKDVKILSNLVNMLLATHRNPDDLRVAEETIGKLEQVNARHPLIPYQRGELERLRGNWVASASYLEKALQASPEQDEVYFSLSQTYRRLGRTQDADRLMATYRRRQDLHRRIDEVQIALGANPDDVSLRTKLADLQMQVGDTAAAIQSLQTAHQTNPNDPGVQARIKRLQRLQQGTPPGQP